MADCSLFRKQNLTQMVPALRPLEIVVAQFRLLVNTPAARPYSVSLARSCIIQHNRL